MSGRGRGSRVNTAVRWTLHTPGLRRLIDAWVCELRFAGARTGRDIAMPVMYAEGDDRLVILVGRYRSKRWWRNFERPHPVRVWLRGQPRTGLGHVVPAGTAEHVMAEKTYARRYPRIPLAGEPFVVIVLDPAGA